MILYWTSLREKKSSKISFVHQSSKSLRIFQQQTKNHHHERCSQGMIQHEKKSVSCLKLKLNSIKIKRMAK
jgi:hypothetical protein